MRDDGPCKALNVMFWGMMSVLFLLVWVYLFYTSSKTRLANVVTTSEIEWLPMKLDEHESGN